MLRLCQEEIDKVENQGVRDFLNNVYGVVRKPLRYSSMYAGESDMEVMRGDHVIEEVLFLTLSGQINILLN